MDLSALPLELIWNILDQLKDLPHRKNASLVCHSWNRMLFTSQKAMQNLNLRICGRYRDPALNEQQFQELFDIMSASDRNYVNVEFFFVNFDLPVARDFLHFIVTVCHRSIRCLKFDTCYGLYRSDLFNVLRNACVLEELHVLNRIGYDGMEAREFQLPSLRKVSLHVDDNCQLYQDVCWLAPNLLDLEIKTREGYSYVTRDIETIQYFSRQLKRLSYQSERALSSEEYQRLEFGELQELNLKACGVIELHLIKGLERLRALKLEGNVTDEVICTLSRLTSLESLTLHCDHLQECGKFVQLTHLQNLTSLCLRGIFNYSWNNVTLPNLQRLHVESTGSGIARFLQRTKLISLEIHDPQLNNKVLKRICRHLPEVERLELAKCVKISDGGLKNLAQLRHLKELRLWETNITGEIFKRWQSLPIRKLLIYYSEKLNDRTLEDMGTKLSALQQVVFYDCYSIGTEAVDKLKKKLPNCEVLKFFRGHELPPSLVKERQIYSRNPDFPRGVLKQELPFSWY